MKRVLVLGNRGQPVKDAQYLLTHNRWDVNFHPGKIDGVFGDQMANAIKRAKYYLGYPRDYIRPMFGDRIYHYLLAKNKGGWNLPIDYRTRKIARRPKPPNHRQLVCDYAKWAVSREPSIHYTQIRPMPEHPWLLPMYIDCSAFVTLAYKAAGAADPNRFGYSGSGNTDTLLAYGRGVGVSQLRPADLVFYSDPEHVAIYMGGGHVIEHGSSRGPRWEPTYYRSVTHCRSYLP